MGKLSRDKGAAGEREFRRLFSELVGVQVERNLCQTRDGGKHGDTEPLGNWSIEIKRAAKAEISKWWLQAGEQAGRDKIPALAYRVDRHDWRVIVPLYSIDKGSEVFRNPLYCEDTDSFFSPLLWTAEISLPAFAALVRESIQCHNTHPVNLSEIRGILCQ